VKQRKWWLSGVLIIVLAVGMTSYFLTRNKPTPKSNTPATPAQVVQKPAPTLKASYLVSGDVFWGRGIDYYAKQSPLKDNWPFSRLHEFRLSKYNGWISDMECPVTDRTVPYQTQVDKLILQCPSHYASTVAKYFTAFTLANNHTDNTGAAGFADTRANLAQNGIQFFGNYDKSVIKDLCEVVTMPAQVGKQDASLPIAMCGYHWLDSTPTAGELAQISLYAKYFPVWVFPHGGTEYSIHHSAAQQALYRKFIDYGADVVFGDHPHVIEDTESYHGKLIIYDLGNLIYDQWFDNEVTKSLIMNVQVSAVDDSNLQAYLKLGLSCKSFQDSCLTEAKAQHLKAYKLSYSYQPIVGVRSNDNLTTRATHPGTAADQKWLLNRLDWSVTSAGLQ